jgi:hypothetical protein
MQLYIYKRTLPNINHQQQEKVLKFILHIDNNYC